MIKFSEFTYTWTYQFAASTRDRIFGEASLVDVEYFFEITTDFQSKALKPQKETFLHELIQHCLEADVEWVMDKGDPVEFAMDELASVLSAYNIDHPISPDDFVLPKGEYPEDRSLLWTRYLEEIFKDELITPIANEVFTLMFADREALRKLNEIIATKVKGLMRDEYPSLLAADGKVYRCKYWPKWLKNALFYRDRGHCSLCLKDLSGVFSAGADLAIDHIVPINFGGTNDPTNLQILCKDCNSSKSSGPSQVSKFQHIYWDSF